VAATKGVAEAVMEVVGATVVTTAVAVKVAETAMEAVGARVVTTAVAVKVAEMAMEAVGARVVTTAVAKRASVGTRVLETAARAAEVSKVTDTEVRVVGAMV
jgi:uncharacterized membrane protein